MSAYDPFSPLRKPWDDYRGPRPAKPPAHRPLTTATTTTSRPPRSSAFPLAEYGELSQASSLNAELLTLRAQEREQLVELNDRFASYIEKVRRLEQRNAALLAELSALRRRRQQADPSRLHLLYQQEARGLRALLEAEAGERARLQAARDRLRAAHGRARERRGEEAERRLEAEGRLRAAREAAGRAALANGRLEGGIGGLVEELAFLKKVQGEERAELAAQVQAAHLTAEAAAAEEEAEAKAAAKPDLSLALREIRCQYEKLAHKNMQAAEDWYRTKFATVSQLASKNSQAVRSIREETAEYHRLLQSRGSEIEGLKGVVDSLQKQLENLEDRQSMEVDKYHERISELEKDINEAKQEMARYLREYQDLLNVKMALDIEIAAYRKLLEGEEFRLSFSSLPSYS